MEDDKLTVENISKFSRYLQGDLIPEGFTLTGKRPNLTNEQAWEVIYVLQEWLHVIPDKFERCDECEDIFDTDLETCCHVDDLEECLEIGFNVTVDDVGKTFCGDCR